MKVKLLCKLRHDWWYLPLGIPAPGQRHRLTRVCERCRIKQYLRHIEGVEIWVPWEGQGTYSEKADA